MNTACFSLKKASALGRLGTLATAHGTIGTPFFLPVATAGAMKGISFDHLLQLGAQALLCNTYHLHLNPGEEVIDEAGGLHSFIGWDKPILTDSGGFQVYSLESIRSISDDGVTFKDHRNGDTRFLSPEDSIRIQHAFGSDIIMCFDECPPSTAKRAKQIEAVDRTLRWALRCKKTHEGYQSHSLLFGIIQGGLERDLREKCAQELIAIGFDGYAVGGLAVGESEQEMFDVLDIVCPLLPSDAPRYLMGVGDISQQRVAIAKGIDMFDCVSPMREARHGSIWMTDGTKIRIKRAEFKRNFEPLDSASASPLSRQHSKAYVHHLLRIGERYGETIACLQNMALLLDTMRSIHLQINKST